MPVDKEKYLKISSKKTEDEVNKYIQSKGGYKWIDGNTRFSSMSDCILIPGINGVGSIGDIFSLSLPIIVLVQYSRRRYKPPHIN